MTYADWAQSQDLHLWEKKWYQKKLNSTRQSKHFALTLTEYMTKGYEIGISASDIGTSLDSYQLGRIGDTGGYTVPNCRFITREQNLLEQKQNNKYVNSMRGNTHSLASKQLMSKQRSGKRNTNWRGYIVTPKGVFDTTALAADAYSTWSATISSWCRNPNNLNFYYDRKGE